MNNSRLIQIVKSFTQKEFDDFRNLTRSNFFSSASQDVQQLFNLLNVHYPTFDHPDLNKKNAYQKIYGEIDWIPGKLDKLLTQALRMVFQFVGIYFSKDYFNPQATICSFLRDRSLFQIFGRELNKFGKQIDTYSFYDSGTLYEAFNYHELKVGEQFKAVTPKSMPELPQLLHSLDQYYYLTKLQYACQLLSINLFIFPIDLEDSLKSLKSIHELIHLPHLQLPSIQVFFQAYKLLMSEEAFQSQEFISFEELLYKHEEELTEVQQKALHTLIRNYALFQYHKGQKDYLAVVFKLYKYHLNKGYLHYEGKIRAQPFHNIVTSSLRLQEYEWSYQFILAQKGKIISPESSGVIYNFNLALYYYATKKYEEALNVLPHNFEDYYFKIRGKILELKIFYEKDASILDAKVDAFYVFIYRAPLIKITDRHKKGCIKFIRFLKQVLHPKTAFNANRIDKLIDKIQTANNLVEKEWLITILQQER